MKSRHKKENPIEKETPEKKTTETGTKIETEIVTGETVQKETIEDRRPFVRPPISYLLTPIKA
jgi:hypothetical protein